MELIDVVLVLCGVLLTAASLWLAYIVSHHFLRRSRERDP